MKFSEMPYARPELDKVMAGYNSLLERFQAAKTPEECFAVYKEYDEYSQDVNTMFSLANIRNTLNTADEFYGAEKAYMNEARPKLSAAVQKFNDALLASPFRKDMEREWGTLMFKNIEINQKTFKPEIIPDLQEENKLTTAYEKLIASALIEYDGKKLTLPQMRPYYENPDRAKREAAIRAGAGWYMANSEKLDGLYDELVKIRTRIANKLGYENFVELGYYRMRRNSYDQTMVSKFREGVVNHIVPVASRLKDAQAKRIGVPKLRIYDDSFAYPDGNAKPIGTPDDIFAHGKKMYHELSEETAEFMDFMLENELFDVLSKPGKASGGYCATLAKFKSPFIFANFNGTSGDIDVLTHEAGHAFASYIGKNIYPSDLRRYTSETAEVHSMSMEFFTWPWMEGFFGDKTPKYRYSHLAHTMEFIPYGTMVDEFQHHVYAKPGMSPKDRNGLWLELEGKYRPWLDLKDFPFYGEGRRWQSQGHIYKTPFYYIDYCLAQTIALCFWAEDQKDHEKAWAKYRRFVGLAGTKTFIELLADAELPSPFVQDTLKTVSSAVTDWLDARK